MFTITMASILSFISTNIDDIFLLMVLYAQAKDEKSRRLITAGQYLGMGALVGISILGAFGIGFLPGQYTRYLGILPIILGCKMWTDYKKEQKNVDGTAPIEQTLSAAEIKLWGVAMLTVAGGADNIGVYTPVFSVYSSGELVFVAAIFIVMTGLWCLAGSLLSSHSVVRNHIQKYKHILVPAVLTGLGIFILLG